LAKANKGIGKKQMTLKRRLFISNILMTVLPLALVWALMLGIGSALLRLSGISYGSFTTERQAMLGYWKKDGFGIVIMLIMMALGSIIMVAVNQLLTRNIIKRVMQPLDTLCAGARQFSKNNLNFRLEYHTDDEFRPVCDTFNEMASRLEKNENSRKELIAGISHDLRTPLLSIKMSVGGIKSGVAATAEQRKKYFDIIENKTRDIEHIIEQLFLFSKLDIDEFKTETQIVNCGAMIDDFIAELRGEYERRGLELIARELPKDIYISIDPLLFHRVIINIFENAAKYKTAEKGQIFLGAARKKEMVEITFADNGPGVPPDSVEKLFNVFYRADSSRNNAARSGGRTGSGLGLAISAKIIAKMGGTIHAELPEAGGLAIVINLPQVNKLALAAKDGDNGE
jgi:signal transduction histidine kinase